MRRPVRRQKRRIFSFRCLERGLIALLVCLFGTIFLTGLQITDQANDTGSMSTTQQNAGNLWSNNTDIPEWIKEYMDWHTTVVPTLNSENWRNYNYVILRCYRADERCGGVSDRLKPVPLVLLAAQRSKRILFIDWDRPCPLQEFLVTPPGGFRWSLPPSIAAHVSKESNSAILTRAQNLIRICEGEKVVLWTHIHDTQGGMTQYDEALGAGSFARVYHSLFRIFFQPSKGVQQQIDDKSESHGLIPGEYHVAHFRAEYGKEADRHPKLREEGFLRKVTINAIRCASEFPSTSEGRNTPIFFASDNIVALQTANEIATGYRYPIVTFQRSETSPLRLDQYNTSRSTEDPSLYYSTFVDLYLAGSGDCVTFGRGGFGRFASLLSFNHTCSSKHVKQFFPVECKGRPPFDEAA